jgi:hypothetical protein
MVSLSRQPFPLFMHQSSSRTWKRMVAVIFLALACLAAAETDCPDEAGEDFTSVRKFAVSLHNQVSTYAYMRMHVLQDSLQAAKECHVNGSHNTICVHVRSVCMYACMQASMYACMYTNTRANTYICTYMHTHTHTHTHAHTHTHTHHTTHTHTRMYTCA